MADDRSSVDKAIDNDNHIWAQERHRRRVMLMRELGKTNRMEARMHVLWIVAAVLGVIAFVMMGLS